MDYTDVRFSSIQYLPPVKVGNKMLARVKYDRGNGREELDIRVPPLRLCKPVQVSENRCFVVLELDRQHVRLNDFFSDLDSTNIKVVLNQTMNWFGKKLPEDIVEDLYKPYVRPGRKMQIKANLRHTNGQPELDLEGIEEGSIVKLVMRYEGIKFSPAQFSNLWTVIDMKLVPPNEDIDYAFFGDPYDEYVFDQLAITIADSARGAKTPTSVDRPSTREDFQPEEPVSEPDESVAEPPVKVIEDYSTVFPQDSSTNDEMEFEQVEAPIIDIPETIPEPVKEEEEQQDRALRSLFEVIASLEQKEGMALEDWVEEDVVEDVVEEDAVEDVAEEGDGDAEEEIEDIVEEGEDDGMENVKEEDDVEGEEDGVEESRSTREESESSGRRRRRVYRVGARVYGGGGGKRKIRLA